MIAGRQGRAKGYRSKLSDRGSAASRVSDQSAARTSRYSAAAASRVFAVPLALASAHRRATAAALAL